MIYIILFFILLSIWQIFMRGRLSQLISGIALILAIILLIIGLIIGKIEIKFIFHVIFTFVSIFILMQIYRFSTYHRHFPIMAPIIIGYAILISYLIIRFNFSNYFVWYILYTIGFLILNYSKQLQSLNVSSFPADMDQKLVEKSLKNTLKYHIISSVIYIVFSILSFLFFFY